MKRKDDYHPLPFFPDFMTASRCDRLRVVAFGGIAVTGTFGIFIPIVDTGGGSSSIGEAIVGIFGGLGLLTSFLIFVVFMPIVYAFNRPRWATDPEWRELEGAAVRWWKNRRRQR